jgi:hypothetical protein
MRSTRLMFVACIAIVLAATITASGAPPSQNPRAARRTARDRIALAPTPSIAVQAYGQGLSTDPDSTALRQAFLQRMVRFGMPQMAAAEARDLIRRDPHDGLAWGVVSFTQAATGDTTAALRDIVSATRYAPRDPFVDRTAGQLLAWFDTEADWRFVPPQLMHELDALRERLRDTEPFATTYWAARRSYEFRNDEGLPNLAAPFYPPPYASPVPAWTHDRDRALRPRAGRLVRGADRGPQIARRGMARHGQSALSPPLPDQPLPRPSPPLPRLKQPIVPPGVPLTPAPAYTQNELPPRRP